MKLHSLACLREGEFLQSILNSVLGPFLWNQKVRLLDKRHTRLSVYRGYSASHGYYGADWEQTEAEKDRNCVGGSALSSPAQGRQRTHYFRDGTPQKSTRT